ncbi:MAG: GNAT family N-acetyltransferase [Bacteroidota bacterium]|nr:GNAT family N-acetyltransferase [Bacteroidota bacterium]
MIITGFGVVLVRLQHHDIELVRNHRNSAAINQYMEFRREISKEEQEKWFTSIDTKFNNYFLINYKGELSGLIYGADINWEKKETGNGGIFIWKEELLETHAPLAASLLLTEVSFLLGMERTYIKVMRDNPRAISYNLNLGYEILPGQENVENQKYVLTKENYFLKAGRFRKSFVRMFGEVFTIRIDHPSHEAEANIIAVYRNAPEENKARLIMEEK